MMNKDSNVSMPVGIDHESDSAQRWPQFSEQEVRRLEFLVYLRQTGRILPVRTETDSAAPWPQLSQQELRRLEFLRHLRQTGRIPPAPAVPAEVDALCASLLAPPPLPTSRPASHHSRERSLSSIPAGRGIRGGIPLTWAVYAEKYGARRPSPTGDYQVER
jgi:hypothetical protein